MPLYTYVISAYFDSNSDRYFYIDDSLTFCEKTKSSDIQLSSNKPVIVTSTLILMTVCHIVKHNGVVHT